MFRKIILLSILVFSIASFGAIEKIELRKGWRFEREEFDESKSQEVIKFRSGALLKALKGDYSAAPEFDWTKCGYDDSKWREVTVPHDWGVEKPFDSSRKYGDAFLDVTGAGRYRLEFLAPESWRGKTVYFECDGAMSYSMAYVNGSFKGGWPYGYTRWRIDMTKSLEYGKTNTLAISCVNIPDSSRWYTGGGLYRRVRFLICPEDHVLPGSVHITTDEITSKSAKVHVRYEMSKSGVKEKTFTVENPRLWDIDDPYLHTVDIEGDTYRYGIRTISYHADGRGFMLNGRSVPLNGVSMHHEFGVLGAGWNRKAQKRRLLLFKEAGVNAIRSAHNPPDEGLLELCDEMGILVKDEVFDEWRHIGLAGKRKNGYTNLFDDWHELDLKAWVRTDRNHPSVIMYCIGNEICDGFQKICPAEEYVSRARSLERIVQREDSTRPCTLANNNPANFTNNFPSVMPIMGCNYSSWQFPELKKRHPGVPFFSTESVCMSSSRGVYHFPVVQKWSEVKGVDFHNSSYCWESADWEKLDEGWASAPDAQWWWMDKAGTSLGEFIWTGIDYLGGPYWCDTWRKSPVFTDPEKQRRADDEVKNFGLTKAAIHSCNTGFLDLAGFKKDSFYLFQSRWMSEKPMAHILPHWNWPGREGKVTPVYVFTSGDEGELFLNGKSLGRSKKDKTKWDRAYRLRWDDVKYEPGVLEVIVYKNGKFWARDKVETTLEPSQLTIEAEEPSIISDGEDVAYVNVSIRDAKGRLVPTSSNEVVFSVEGPGEIVATDNGDETDFADFRSPRRKVFGGLAQVIVRATEGSSGVIRVKAVSPGLGEASCNVNVVAR